jgi:hypothetical protein
VSKYLGLNFDHYKPEDYNRGGEDSELSSDVEDGSAFGV